MHLRLMHTSECECFEFCCEFFQTNTPQLCVCLPTSSLSITVQLATQKPCVRQVNICLVVHVCVLCLCLSHIVPILIWKVAHFEIAVVSNVYASIIHVPVCHVLIQMPDRHFVDNECLPTSLSFPWSPRGSNT